MNMLGPVLIRYGNEEQNRHWLPRILDERSKELLREFGRINGENVRE